MFTLIVLIMEVGYRELYLNNNKCLNLPCNGIKTLNQLKFCKVGNNHFMIGYIGHLGNFA